MVLASDLLREIRLAVESVGPPPLKLVGSILMVDYVEDWSRVRSRGRGERRRRAGKRQNIVTLEVPKKEAIQIGDTIYMHPTMLELVKRATQR